MPLILLVASGWRFRGGFVWLRGIDAFAPLSVRLVLALTSFLDLSSVGRGSASSEKCQLQDSVPPRDFGRHLQSKLSRQCFWRLRNAGYLLYMCAVLQPDAFFSSFLDC